jgi:hypothetical protein
MSATLEAKGAGAVLILTLAAVGVLSMIAGIIHILS